MLKKNKTYHKRGELIHGFKPMEHPLYGIWANMKRRCNNSKDVGYQNYGGRGITYDSQWEHFENFAKDMWPKPDNAQIDRINNDGNYCKENCRWATIEENAQNKRVYKTNKFNSHGVKLQPSGAYNVRVMRDGVRYNLGNFKTIEEATTYRDLFLDCLNRGNKLEIGQMLERRVRLDSQTQIKGITVHQDGGYLVRKTINKVRVYLGYIKTLEGAIDLLVNGVSDNENQRSAT